MITIDWMPDKSSDIPIYKQIIDYVKGKISNGEWEVGDRLPTQRELSHSFNVNRSTIIQALDELKSEGLIEGKGSKGTRIVNNTWSVITSTPPPNWQDYIESGIHRPNLPTIQAINSLEFKPSMIRLGTGELSPDIFPKEMMKKVMNRVSGKMNSLGYEQPKGSPYLRKVLSEYLKKYNINVSPESILIVSGSLQALQLISMGILHHGSMVLTEKPSYLKSLHIFQSAGMNLKGINMDGHGIIASEIQKNKSNNKTTLLYTIPTFHNPTGIVMPERRRRQILEICEEERLPIIEDDAYRELWIDDEPPMPIKSKDNSGIVLYLGSISKTLAAGLRIGWLVGPQPVIDRLGDIKMQTDYGASSLSQLTLAEWISSGLYDEYLLRLRNEIKLRREIALRTLEENFSDIASWDRPRGGFYIWTKLTKKISMNRLFSMALKEKLLINPGNIYDFAHNQNLRISYSYASLDDLESGLKRLSEVIRECYRDN
ncbi:PLP-dependent aminotransferase family protein [Wukongibacter baidiensis]|uniref:aminotransferase-like domain-containing protein n=1 Tax=Wukongibacter baidiensis TaxID=1723361 RepID=UPI003D7FA518